MGRIVRTAADRDYRWIVSLLLLAYLSFMAVLVPMGDEIPDEVLPSNTPYAARPHPRVVLFLVDGLGYRKALKTGLMPHLQANAKRGACGKGLASFPTITPSGLRAILSGRQVSAERQLPTGIATPPEVDSVLSRASAARLRARVVAQFIWPVMFPDGHGAKMTIIPYEGYKGRKISSISPDHFYDQQVVDAIEEILHRKRHWDFLAVHFFESDPLGHTVRTDSSQYKEHLTWLDGKIDDLSKSMQAQKPTAFLVVGDHGQEEDGSHGGLTAVEREVPFILWGAGIKRADLGTFPLYNAAPTLAALLGVRPPSMNEGWPMVEAMDLDRKQRAAISIDLLSQRLGRWSVLRRAWPWLTTDPAIKARNIRQMYKAGNYAGAGTGAERFIRDTDKAIQGAWPEKWMWRLIASLWCLVFASTFFLAWRQSDSRLVGSISLLGAAILILLIIPITYPASWAWASSGVFGCAMAILAIAVASGLGKESQMGWFGWGLWWLALLGISFQEVLDISLWSWFIICGLLVSHCLHLTKENMVTSVLSLISIGTCAVLVSGMRSIESSWIRVLVVPGEWNWMAHPSWGLVEGIVSALILAGGYFSFGPGGTEGSWKRYFEATGPLMLALILMRWRPGWGALSWFACISSAVAMMRLPLASVLRGMWLSAVTLAFYRTMTDERQWCFLALAVVAGWGLAWETRDAHPLWEGLGLLGVGLWSFKLTGGTINFSHITIAEGSRILGEGWHPYILLALLTLKQVAAVAAPILPFLYSRSLQSVVGMLPLMGALSAGSLSMLWWDRYMKGRSQRFMNELGYTQMFFILILAWLLLTLWAFIRAMDRIARRAHGISGA